MFTIEDFNAINYGEVFRVVTTKHHKVILAPNKPELMFVCIKSDGHEGWCIYYGFADQSVSWITANGEKLTIEENIRSIFPCDEEVFKLYYL